MSDGQSGAAINNPEIMARPLGSKNKATANAREAVARFVDFNAVRMQGWLDELAADAPDKALKVMIDLMEFHIPKLARTEHVGDGGGPVVLKLDDADQRA